MASLDTPSIDTLTTQLASRTVEACLASGNLAAGLRQMMKDPSGVCTWTDTDLSVGEIKYEYYVYAVLYSLEHRSHDKFSLLYEMKSTKGAKDSRAWAAAVRFAMYSP